MKTAIAAAFLLLVVPGLAAADVLYDDAITFGPSYAFGPPAGFPWGVPPDQGAPLFIFGMVSHLGAPFTDLLPAGSYEITCVLEGGTCGGYGMWDDLPCSGGMDAPFYGGTMSIYLDPTPDADFMDFNSFRDGEMVLQAQTQVTSVTDDDPYENCPMVDDRPDVRTWFLFSGGSWFHRVDSGSGAMSGLGEGEIPGHYPDNVPPALQAMGYTLRIDGTMDIFGPTAVKPTTWGHVKSLYR